MHAMTISINPNVGKSNEIDEFVVVPPRDEPFIEEGWIEGLAVHLAREFPALKIHIYDEPGMRHFEEVSVVPIVGAMGTEGDGGYMKPVTIKTNQIIAQIRTAVRTWRPAEILLLN